MKNLLCLLLLIIIFFSQSSSGYRWSKVPSSNNHWRARHHHAKRLNAEPRNVQSDNASKEELIKFSDKAKAHLQSMKRGSPLHLRMGVKKGGCSGMSYVLDIISAEDIQPQDHIEIIDDDIKCVVDPKSTLFLHGLELDYSDALIGGGFKFLNPNAQKSCGCGKSFGV